MSQPLKNVIVIGAGSVPGPAIIHAIDSNPNLTLSVLTRQSSKTNLPSHIKIHTIADSYPEDQLIAILKGQDAVVDIGPPSAVELHKSIIDAAIKTGVKRYIPSEFGSKSTEPRVIEAVPMFGGKIAVKDYLKSKESEGLTWTAINNGSFFD
ncbi:MAG: hypothetical protein Q9217_005685, partial [Psora testacea]